MEQALIFELPSKLFSCLIKNFVWADQRIKVCCIFHKALFRCEECFINWSTVPYGTSKQETVKPGIRNSGIYNGISEFQLSAFFIQKPILSLRYNWKAIHACVKMLETQLLVVRDCGSRAYISVK